MLRPMNYILSGLDPQPFRPLLALDDAALAARGMRWMTADSPFGFPCRVGLEDAPVGARLLLLHYVHQDSRSPYRASGPIFVRPDLPAARRIEGELPPYLTERPLSLRAYDATDDMVDADVIDGSRAEPLIRNYLGRPEVAYLHVHFARRGCYGGRVDRSS
jgi:hypothetical protein